MPRPQQVTPEMIFNDIEAQFNLDDESLLTITRKFLEDFNAGLSEYGKPMAMIPTFVTGVPNGTETGTFLALDLGGTNLRVCEVQLHGDQTFTLRQQKYKVSTALKTGEASVLFDYLADSVDAFLTDSGYDFPDEASPESALPLGFTFSFPVEQTALDRGTLLTWTKGFSARNTIGNDVVRLLQDAFERKHMHVRCVALVNDTVGALLSRAYTAGGCLLGCIFGTGTNGAYVEDVSKITKLNSDVAPKQGKMIINAEWGAFNNTRSTLPSTLWDNKVDRESINPKFQAFEKFISGMYLGEITRNVMLSLVDAAPRSLLFNGQSTKTLNTHYGLDTAVMSAVEEAWEAIPKELEEKAVEEEKKLESSTLKGVHAGGPSVESTTATTGVTTTASTATTTTTDKRNAPPSYLPIAKFFEPNFNEQNDLDHAVRARLNAIKNVLVKELGFEEHQVSLRDAAVVHWICRLVAGRAAKLSGCAVAAVAIQTGHANLGAEANAGFDPKTGKVAVGVDGSLIQFYPNFETHLRESLRVLVGPEVEKATEIGMAKDGSGVGAALCALQAIKQMQHVPPSPKVLRASSTL